LKKIQQEQETKKLQEEKKRNKEIARKEFAERHEKKRIKALLRMDKPEEPAEDERKMFVGGLVFDDLKRHNLDQKSVEKIKKERAKQIMKMFDRFEGVVKKKDFILSKRHCFVIFQDKASCEKAIEILKKFERREKISQEIKETLEKEGGKFARLQAPTSHFYVRQVRTPKQKFFISRKNKTKK